MAYADQREAQKTQAGNGLAIQRREKPIQAIRLLPRLGHHDFITGQQQDVPRFQQVLPNDQPLDLAPGDGGIEEALDRPITTARFTPARQP
jgi:hypothetical protein